MIKTNYDPEEDSMASGCVMGPDEQLAPRPASSEHMRSGARRQTQQELPGTDAARGANKDPLCGDWAPRSNWRGEGGVYTA